MAQLPVKSLFEETVLSWECVYYHYRKWYLANVFKQSWISILEKHKSKLDLSSVDFDGSHTSRGFSIISIVTHHIIRSLQRCRYLIP